MNKNLAIVLIAVAIIATAWLTTCLTKRSDTVTNVIKTEQAKAQAIEGLTLKEQDSLINSNLEKDEIISTQGAVIIKKTNEANNYMNEANALLAKLNSRPEKDPSEKTVTKKELNDYAGSRDLVDNAKSEGLLACIKANNACQDKVNNYKKQLALKDTAIEGYKSALNNIANAPKVRNKVLVGFDVIGSTTQLTYIGVAAGIQFKQSDNIYRVMCGVSGGQLVYGGGVMIPLRF